MPPKKKKTQSPKLPGRPKRPRNTEPLPYATFDEDRLLRLWVYELIHANEYVNLHKATLDYCQKSFEWLKGETPRLSRAAARHTVPLPPHQTVAVKFPSDNVLPFTRPKRSIT